MASEILDTDILVDHFHGHAAATTYIGTALHAGTEVYISVVSVTELLAGMRPGEESKTEQLLGLFWKQDVTESIAKIAGSYLNQFAESHHIELADALIAATARVLNATLVTRNLKHYPMTDIAIRKPYERG